MCCVASEGSYAESVSTPAREEELIETIVDTGDLCGECPVWDEETGTLYWVDCVGRRFYRYTPETGQHDILNDGLEINGFRLNRPGGFVIANSGGIWLWDGAGSKVLIAAEVDGAKCRMNDCVADARGRLFAGTCFYDPHHEYELGKLLRVDPDGKTAIVDEGFHLANGIAFSPEYDALYFTDSVARRIYRYDYDAATGACKNRRVLIQAPLSEGLPDGLTVDAEGFLWSAQWYGACVVRYDPTGKPERRIPAPAKQTSCVTFGGADLTDLYITSAARSEPMPVMPPGYDAFSGYFGGALYRVRTNVHGRPAARANITLPDSSD